MIGAVPYERTSVRTGQRNGHGPGVLASTAGDLELRIPKLRAGSFFAIRHKVSIFLRDRRSPLIRPQTRRVRVPAARRITPMYVR